jgi:cytochrome P450
MHFLDNIVQETLWLHQVDLLNIQRLMMADLVINNGLYLKKGTSIVVQSYSLHRDPEIYPNPEDFDQFRHMRPGYHGSQTDYGGSRQGTKLTDKNAQNSHPLLKDIYLLATDKM